MLEGVFLGNFLLLGTIFVTVRVAALVPLFLAVLSFVILRGGVTTDLPLTSS